MLSKCGVGYSYTNAMYPSFVTSRSDGKTYAPDTNGNTQSGDGRTFAWTVDNRVASVANGSGTTTMDYDYTGARVKKFGPLGQVLYPFAGYEIGPDGTKTKYFRIGTEIVGAKQTPVSNPEKRLFYHADHLGGTNVITDVNGARVQLIEYDPWGKTSRNEGNGDPERRFTGQILDPESGLYYYGARYYDPELARFISPDPIVPSPGDPQSLNRYSYVRNNPVKYIDPTGHSFWSAIGNFFKNLFRRPEVFFATLIVGLVTGGLAYTFLVPALGIALGSWGAFAVAGAVGGAFAGLTSAGMTGGNLWQGALMGGIAGAVGGAVGGWVGGGEITFGGVTAGAFAGGFVSGGLGTAFNGGNFFQNAMVGAIGSTVVAAAMYGVVKAAGELYQRWKSMPGAAPRASGASDRCIDCSDIVDQDGVQKTGGPSAKPPIGVPGGGPGNDWKWNPDPGNSRGGTWGPQNPLPRQSQPSASWDPQGHWDVDDGFSNRSRYDQNGRYLTPDQAHGRVPIVPAPRFIEPMFPMIIPNVPAFRNFLDSLTGRNNQPI
jgi:RHS repeat-associated protein